MPCDVVYCTKRGDPFAGSMRMMMMRLALLLCLCLASSFLTSAATGVFRGGASSASSHHNKDRHAHRDTQERMRLLERRRSSARRHATRMGKRHAARMYPTPPVAQGAFHPHMMGLPHPGMPPMMMMGGGGYPMTGGYPNGMTVSGPYAPGYPHFGYGVTNNQMYEEQNTKPAVAPAAAR